MVLFVFLEDTETNMLFKVFKLMKSLMEYAFSMSVINL